MYPLRRNLERRYDLYEGGYITLPPSAQFLCLIGNKEIGERLGKSADAIGMLLSRAMVSLTSVFESDV